MDIAEFLNRNIIDIYGEYVKKWEGVSAEEFDSSFILENNQWMSDDEYISLNYKDMYNDMVFEELYIFICDEGIEKDISLERIVSFLASKTYVYNYDNKKLIYFLDNSSLEEIINAFIDNYDLGMFLVKSYFWALVDKKRYDKKRKEITDSKSDGRLLILENKALNDKVITISSILRDIICNLYNFYIANGCDKKTAANNTWEYFIKDFDPLGELDKMGYDLRTKRVLQYLALVIIYSDLYEDICNEAIIDNEDINNRKIKVFISMSVHLNTITIPSDEELRNDLLKYFILLHDEKEKRKVNRERTHIEKRIQILKKVNPIYFLDELT